MDDYDISGGGTIEEALEDKQSKVRDQVLLRNYNWEKAWSALVRGPKATITNQNSF